MTRFFRLGLRALTSVLFIFLVFRITSIVHLFYEHAGIILTQEQVAQAYYEARVDLKSPTIPRIIHQIYHNWTDPSNESLPNDWEETRQTCIDFNKNWENRLWTEKTSREFLTKEYPWFLPTYDRFKYPIQKIDALRYFLLRHFGGIYIDLDNGCMSNLEPLRYYPAWVVDGARGALSNDILGGEPHHPYWVLMTDSIISYAWNYPLPYITISYATGQWFETEIWEKYHRQLPKQEPVLTRINVDGRPGAAPSVFFTHTRGGTWENWDNEVFKWIGDHLFISFLLLAGLPISIVFTTRGFLKIAKRQWQRRKGFVQLDA